MKKLRIAYGKRRGQCLALMFRPPRSHSP
jgi:hypothetical protein